MPGPLLERYQRIRQTSLAICAPLLPEDHVIQGTPDTSPPKWHLAHTSWFFESLILGAHVPGYRPHHPGYAQLFNSYYKSLGEHWLRPQRGLLSRPGVAEIHDYRSAIDRQMADCLDSLDNLEQRDPAAADSIRRLTDIGLHHEQQHQELLLMDIQQNFALNPLNPVYRPAPAGADPITVAPARWVDFPGGLLEIGHQGTGFAYDNETPRHLVHLAPFRLHSRPVNNREYLAFMADDGYRRPEFWTSDGWDLLHSQGWRSPAYWRQVDGDWWEFGLHGLRPLDLDASVRHLSHHEAWAYAEWAGFRLPTEAEWESAAHRHHPLPRPGDHFLDDTWLIPRPIADDGQPLQAMLGNLWEWTAGAYLPYPGFRRAQGPLGEYNAKFMSGQMVLRGGCLATPRDHIRLSYRNFYQPEKRWPFTGLRLAETLDP